MSKDFDINDIINKGYTVDKRFVRKGTNEKNSDVISDFDRGMQKMITEIMSAYLLSDEAERLGVVEVKAVRDDKEDSIGVNTSFLIKRKRPLANIEDDYDEFEDDEDCDEDDNLGFKVKELSKEEFFDMINKIYSSKIKEDDDNEKPKRRGRKKKSE